MILSLFRITKLLTSWLFSDASQATGPVDLGDALVGGSGSGLIQTLVDTIIKLPFIIFPAMIIIGGIMYMVSGSNEQNMKKAQSTLVWGFVGFLISMLAFGIVILVKKLLAPNANVDPTTLPQPMF